MASPPSDPGPATPASRALDDERSIWLATLYEANARMVFTTCRRYLTDPEEAADATQEVFLRAAASLHVPPDSKDARAWLTTVARNYSMDLLRRRRRLRSALTTLGASATPLESETVVVDRQLAQAVLEQLAVRERQALWDSHVEDRSVTEIAKRLGLSYAAAAQLLSRARRRAALVAAELAALLAWLRWGLRRSRAAIQNLGQPLATVLVVPLVVTALISTGSAAPSAYAAHAVLGKAAHRPALKPNQSQSHANPGVAVLPSSHPTRAVGTGNARPVVGGTGKARPVVAQFALAAVATRPSTPPQGTVSIHPPAPTAVGPPRKKGHHRALGHFKLKGDRLHDALAGGATPR